MDRPLWVEVFRMESREFFAWWVGEESLRWRVASFRGKISSLLSSNFDDLVILLSLRLGFLRVGRGWLAARGPGFSRLRDFSGEIAEKNLVL